MIPNYSHLYDFSLTTDNGGFKHCVPISQKLAVSCSHGKAAGQIEYAKADLSLLPGEYNTFTKISTFQLSTVYYFKGKKTAVLFRGKDFIVIKGRCKPGDSGRGLYDENGYLAGICHGYGTKEDVTVFVSSQAIKQFIEGLKK